MTKYLLDTNILIEAKNRYYRFSFCPAFWDWLKRQHALGTVASIEKVADEISSGNDELTEWVEKLPSTFFEIPSKTVTSNQEKIIDYVQNLGDFSQAKKNDFISGADTWLIAHAMASSCTIVTGETYSTNNFKIKIPNVCQHFNVPYKSTFEMLEDSGAKFVL